MSNIIKFDPIYLNHKRMWIEDRWKFSGAMVQLTIKKSRDGLDEAEQYILDTLNRIVEEFDGKWLENIPTKKMRKKG
jgi:hypothetical protein